MVAEALHDLTAAQAAGLIASRQLSPVELMEALLRRMERTEPALHAWVGLDFESARVRAAEAERAPAGGRLHGIPFGVKDVIDVAGLPTGCGFAPFASQTAREDASAVAGLHGAGAIAIGKTATTQFAFRDPPDTLNPWDPTRSPGGSSTGSAVAVAARQVPFALGTQTSGSVLRPAAFNGVVGFKPSFGRISRRGVFPDAWSLDHVGVLARSVEDCGLVAAAAAPNPPAAGAPQAPSAAVPPARPFRLGLLEAALQPASQEVAEHVRRTADHFESEGASVIETRLGYSLELIHAVHQVTMQSEMAAAHRDLLELYPDAYRPGLRSFLEVGSALPAWAYVHAQRIRRLITLDLEAALRAVDAIVLPTCSSLAPARESGTGDSSLQAPFSLIGAPSISLPSKPGESGLPLAIQLAAPAGSDRALLAVARWCESRLESPPAPPRLPSNP